MPGVSSSSAHCQVDVTQEDEVAVVGVVVIIVLYHLSDTNFDRKIYFKKYHGRVYIEIRKLIDAFLCSVQFCIFMFSTMFHTSVLFTW